jgi:hypothetical protein
MCDVRSPWRSFVTRSYHRWVYPHTHTYTHYTTRAHISFVDHHSSMASPTAARFARAVLMVRGAEGMTKAVDFYHGALGLSVLRHSDEWAELTCGRSFTLNLQAVSNEAQLSVGYSPMLSFGHMIGLYEPSL